MPFKVSAKLICFLGDENKYPCHFNYRVGDEIIWDGEKFIGRICPYVLPNLSTVVSWLFSAGPRYKQSAYYKPFWYASLSLKDPSYKKFDGIGFKPVLISQEPFPGLPAGAFQWPPSSERLFKDVTVVCPDLRTAALFKLETFDLADKGDSIPYFRRQMTILNKVLQKQGLMIDKIIDEFTEEEKYGIYPPLSPLLIEVLVEELELINYVEFKDRRVYLTSKGKAKLEDFLKSLSEEERLALHLES